MPFQKSDWLKAITSFPLPLLQKQHQKWNQRIGKPQFGYKKHYNQYKGSGFPAGPVWMKCTIERGQRRVKETTRRLQTEDPYSVVCTAARCGYTAIISAVGTALIWQRHLPDDLQLHRGSFCILFRAVLKRLWIFQFKRLVPVNRYILYNFTMYIHVYT